MAGPRPLRHTLLALSAFLLLATAIAWTLGRRSAPEVGVPLAQGDASPDVSAPPPANPLADSPPDLSRIPHTRLPLRLLATVVRENHALSLATIEDLERTTREVLNEGESLEGHPNARIAQIERARILIDHDGVREQLVISQRGPAPEAAPVSDLAPEERERRRDLAERLRDLTDAGAGALQPAEGSGLVDEGDVSAVYENGEMVGVQFEGIRAGGIYDRIGLRNGDVMTGINGVSLGEPAAAAEVLGEFANSDELAISVQRGDGSQETLHIPTAELKPALESLE